MPYFQVFGPEDDRLMDLDGDEMAGVSAPMHTGNIYISGIFPSPVESARDLKSRMPLTCR